ncbi:MAG: hypothetical protein F4201_06645 [Nitrospira sp. SB0677_bin_15]|nr:hypothetical protein [Nitrospira sp. SB0677_bin_15]
MTETLRRSLTQRADYTQTHNAKSGRYGWLRLTPAYSLKIVNEILDTYSDLSEVNVLDPFCGTGTTALCAAYHGQTAVTIDINPFLVWFSRTKIDFYPSQLIADLRQVGHAICDDIRYERAPKVLVPHIHNIERWWSPVDRDFLCALKGAIDARFTNNDKRRSLLLIAFCRTLLDLSNAAFNHQSMSFKSNSQITFDFDTDLRRIFLRYLDIILDGAEQNPTGQGKVALADARRLLKKDIGLIDCVITSPPYVNRMSYIRELRPYMYWLGYITNGRDAGEMDWEAIGGTWGVATSRLNEWQPKSNSFKSKLLQKTAKIIRGGENKNGPLLANYVLKYFDDMWSHFQSLIDVLNDGAKLHYIVGNSTFYSVLVPVERVYAEMLSQLGFSNVKCIPIRKRNSKKELIEFDVRARWR